MGTWASAVKITSRPATSQGGETRVDSSAYPATGEGRRPTACPAGRTGRPGGACSAGPGVRAGVRRRAISRVAWAWLSPRQARARRVPIAGCVPRSRWFQGGARRCHVQLAGRCPALSAFLCGRARRAAADGSVGGVGELPSRRRRAAALRGDGPTRASTQTQLSNTDPHRCRTPRASDHPGARELRAEPRPLERAASRPSRLRASAVAHPSGLISQGTIHCTTLHELSRQRARRAASSHSGCS